MWNSDEHDKIFETIDEMYVYNLASQEQFGEVTLSHAIYGAHTLLDKFKLGCSIDRSTTDNFKFNFTVADDDDMIKIVRKFEQMKSQIFFNYPDAKIHIAQRIIAVETEGNVSFYCISDNDILPMNVQNKFELKFIPVERSNAQDSKSIKPVKVGRIAKLTNAFRKMLHERKQMKENKEESNPTTIYSQTVPGKIEFNNQEPIEVAHSEISSYKLQEEDAEQPQQYKTRNSSNHTYEKNTDDLNENR